MELLGKVARLSPRLLRVRLRGFDRQVRQEYCFSCFECHPPGCVDTHSKCSYAHLTCSLIC